MDGIYISTIILTQILGLVMYLTNVKINKRPLFALIITLGCILLARDFIAARAQLVTFILFVLEILFIESFLEKKKKRYVIGLMLIAMLIANLHAAVFYFFFILMLPYIGEYIIAVLKDSNLIYRHMISITEKKIKKLENIPEKQEKLEEKKKKLEELKAKSEKYMNVTQKMAENPYKVKIIKRENAKWLILILILCFAMGLATPLGDEPYTHIFKLMQGNTTDNIAEHQAMILAEHTGAITVITMLTILLMFTDTKIKLKDLFMIGGLLVLAVMTRRQFSMLVLIGGISFTDIFGNFTDKYDKERRRNTYKARSNMGRSYCNSNTYRNLFV